jgi:hypothetical protein
MTAARCSRCFASPNSEWMSARCATKTVQYAEQEASQFTSSSLMPGFIHSSPAMTALVEEVYKIARQT